MVKKTENKSLPAGLRISRDIWDMCEEKRQDILKDRNHPLWPVATTTTAWYSYLIMKTLEEIE
jgi:hypothetical protein